MLSHTWVMVGVMGTRCGLFAVLDFQMDFKLFLHGLHLFRGGGGMGDKTFFRGSKTLKKSLVSTNLYRKMTIFS